MARSIPATKCGSRLKSTRLSCSLFSPAKRGRTSISSVLTARNALYRMTRTSTSMAEMRKAAYSSQHECNHFRPHGSLYDMAPVEFKESRKSLTLCKYNRGRLHLLICTGHGPRKNRILLDYAQKAKEN